VLVGHVAQTRGHRVDHTALALRHRKLIGTSVDYRLTAIHDPQVNLRNTTGFAVIKRFPQTVWFSEPPVVKPITLKEVPSITGVEIVQTNSQVCLAANSSSSITRRQAVLSIADRLVFGRMAYCEIRTQPNRKRIKYGELVANASIYHTSVAITEAIKRLQTLDIGITPDLLGAISHWVSGRRGSMKGSIPY